MSDKRNDNFTIDDILNEAKFYQQSADRIYRGTKKGELLSDSSWSMSDIDSLLRDVDVYRNPPEAAIYTPEVKAEPEITEETSVQESFFEIEAENEEPEDIKIIETPEATEEPIIEEEPVRIDTSHLNIKDMSDTGILSFGKNSPIFSNEDEDEHEDTFYEKPGLVIKMNETDGEGDSEDLEPLPTIIPAHDLISATREYKKIPSTEASDDDENIDGQIKIIGFETDTNDEPIKISEASVEDELRRKKAEKISKFTIYSDDDSAEAPTDVFDNDVITHEPVVYKEADVISTEKKKEIPIENTPEEETSVPFSARLKAFFRIEKEAVELPTPDTNDAYVTTEGKNRIHKDLLERLTKNKKDMIILSVLTVLLLLVTVIPASGGFSGTFGIISVILNIIFLGAAFFIRKDCFLMGIKSIKNKSLNAYVLLSLAAILTAIQSIVVLVSGTKIPVNIYSAVVTFGLLLDCIGVHFKLSTVISNFKFMNINLRGRTYTIQTLEDKKFAENLGRGLLLGNPDIRYSARTKFASKFLELSFDKNLSDKYSEKVVPVALIASGVIAVISALVSGTVLAFFSTFCCALCISLPIGSYLALNLSLNLTNKKLNKDGSMVTGYSAALECGKANSIVVDSASLFLRNECNLHGMKNFENMRLDDVILFSAAMMIEADGPLAKVFKRVIMDKEELLPEVQSLNYEDKLGLSAWVNNQRAFLGNREMMINHNIDVPHEATENKYIYDGRKVMYLAVAGKLAAMFVVSYKADKSLIKPLKILDSNGISILVRTNDSNITENMLAEEFGLSANSIKILNSAAGKTFKERRNTVKKTALAGIVHDGQSKSFLRSVASANVLTLTSNIMMTIQLIGIVLGLLLTFLFAVLSTMSLFGPIQLIAFSAVWTAVMLLIPIIKR